MRHLRVRSEQMCAADTIEYQRSADELDRSGLPGEAKVGAYWLLGNAAAAILAEQRSRRFTEAAEREAEAASDFRARVGALAPSVDPAAIATFTEEIRVVVSESMPVVAE